MTTELEAAQKTIALLVGELDDARAHAGDFAAEAARLRERVREAADLLDECGWVDNSGGEYTPRCPICDGAMPTHHLGCRLNIFLKNNKTSDEGGGESRAEPTVFGCRVVIDDTLPPNEIHLVCGKEIVRFVNIGTEGGTR